jgi:predicted DNA-binding transcriptional regulator AlpA
MKPSPVALNLGSDYVTVREAAQLLGISEQAVHKRIRAGRFPFQLVHGVRVLEREGLERRWWGSSQRLADMPPQGIAALSSQQQQSGPPWERIAVLLNGFLGPDWPAPPWSAEQVNTLEMCIALAHDTAGDD